jgi:hypothetical protein
MLEEFKAQLNQQQQTLVELEDELEMEISRVIALKNKIDADLIEDIEKIEEGLYVEVKMINETKKNVDTILKKLVTKNGDDKEIVMFDKTEFDKKEAELEKYKKRSEKLAKQLIESNEEIERFNDEMDKKLKDRESQMKNELINQLKDKDRLINERLIESKKRESGLMNELESLKTMGPQNSEDVERVKSFFDRKIKNIKTTMSEEFKLREREIAEKAIVAYNKKKEKIYNTIIKEVLGMESNSPEVDQLLTAVRESLNLAEDVYTLENFILCENCGEAVHLSQSKCPSCKFKIS